jgi:hydrogenase expression/formation protein HypC
MMAVLRLARPLLLLQNNNYMCLSIPAKIISVDGDLAKASIGGTIIDVGLHMVSDIQPGDYVLVHTGYALQKISNEEAAESLKVLSELEEISRQTGQANPDEVH